MQIKGDMQGKAVIDEAAGLMSGYCASPKCFNKKSNGRQFCIECLGYKDKPKVKARNNESRVYFIKQGDFVKIGFTRDMEKRFIDLQIANPQELELVGEEKGDYRTERWLHDLFKKQHHRGEWFKLDEELSNYIECLKQGLGIYKTCEMAFKDELL